MGEQIKHIVYLMLENRSLDNVLGWLYDDKTDPPRQNLPKQDPPAYDGLKPNTYFNVDVDGNKHFVVRGTDNMNVPAHDPHEVYAHVNYQLFDTETTPVAPPPPTCPPEPDMGGFYRDFASFRSHPEQIMQSYGRDQLGVLYGLARHYAVSDRYFCSIPSQTNCNRAFSHCGNSLGLSREGVLEAWVNNRDFSFVPGHLGQPQGRQFNQKTLWNVLSEHGRGSTSDWMHYYSHGTWLEDLLGAEGYSYTRDLMQQLQGKGFDGHFTHIDSFYEHARAGTLPAVSFLEPEWGLQALVLGHDIGVNGNDYHPPTNLAPGEALLKRIYEALTANPEAFGETLWIINFDEHGGTYDHVPPPWSAEQPWANGETPKPMACEEGFQFNRFGVRVPLLLVSPLVERGTVFRAEGDTPFDHASIIATILTMMQIPKAEWGLGARVACAPTLEGVLSRSSPRSDLASLEISAPASELTHVDAPPNDIQVRIAHSILHRAIKKRGMDSESAHEAGLVPMLTPGSRGEFADWFQRMRKVIGETTGG
ncbi:MAG: hypothetical protein OXR73_00290 [Myxococcales bacterium]|nr:hypothetical protein [Myxococcales bacterium]